MWDKLDCRYCHSLGNYWETVTKTMCKQGMQRPLKYFSLRFEMNQGTSVLLLLLLLLVLWVTQTFELNVSSTRIWFAGKTLAVFKHQPHVQEVAWTTDKPLGYVQFILLTNNKYNLLSWGPFGHSVIIALSVILIFSDQMDWRCITFITAYEKCPKSKLVQVIHEFVRLCRQSFLSRQKKKYFNLIYW